ncbi:MAG: hypothetical protein V3V96_14740 [Acidiferrobacterales bacterium]
MRRSVEVKVRVDGWLPDDACTEERAKTYCESLAMGKVREALKGYDWFQDADEAEVVDD